MTKIDKIKTSLLQTKIDFNLTEEVNAELNSRVFQFDTKFGAGLVAFKNNDISYFILNLGLLNWARQENFDEDFIFSNLGLWIVTDETNFLNYLIGNKIDFSNIIKN